MGRKATVEDAIAKLQMTIRRNPRPGEESVETRAIPRAFQVGAQQPSLGLTRAEVDALEAAETALVSDLRFEHVRPDVRDRVWEFACRCHLDRDTDHVPQFLSEHSREPSSHICYITVELLKVEVEQRVLGTRLLPLDTKEFTPPKWFELGPPVGSVMAIDTFGTDFGRMSEEARARTDHTLRVLRVALREHMGINDRQLRFRVGRWLTFGDRYSGGTRPAEEGYELGLAADLIQLAERQEVARLPVVPTTDLERRADVALRWMERSRMSGDPLVALLFLFFALEALLGDTAEGLKGAGLAFRQMMLSHVVTGGFTDPGETFFLYDKVRNAAVHGDNPPSVGDDTVAGFEVTVRWTLGHYLNYARENGLVSRRAVLRRLKEHKDRQQLVGWLRAGGGKAWTKFLDQEADVKS